MFYVWLFDTMNIIGNHNALALEFHINTKKHIESGSKTLNNNKNKQQKSLIKFT